MTTSGQTQRLEGGIAWHGARQELTVLSRRMDALEELSSVHRGLREARECKFAEPPSITPAECIKRAMVQAAEQDGMEERAKEWLAKPGYKSWYHLITDFARSESTRARIEGEIAGLEWVWNYLNHRDSHVSQRIAQLRSQLNELS